LLKKRPQQKRNLSKRQLAENQPLPGRKKQLPGKPLQRKRNLQKKLLGKSLLLTRHPGEKNLPAKNQNQQRKPEIHFSVMVLMMTVNLMISMMMKSMTMKISTMMKSWMTMTMI
jgi:hypothetical protein